MQYLTFFRAVFTFELVGFLALWCRGIHSIPDAPFKYPSKVYQDAIVCPRGILNQTGGVVFLVHGASTTGEGTWSGTRFNKELANTGPGFDICWVELPWKGLGDLQLSAEYVAFGIKYLSSLSPASGHKINVIGHSQGGGANIQWALTFWPSIQPLVTKYFSIAGTFKGTDEAKPMCLLEMFWGGCLPSPLQLETKSNYMAAQNSKADQFSGARAHVPTISIYSIYDQVLQWEGSHGKNSYLEGATMLELQSERLCGKGHIVGHLGIVEDQATFDLVQTLIASEYQVHTALQNFDKKSCRHIKDVWKRVISRWVYVITVGLNFVLGPARLHMMVKEYTHLRVVKEPGLQYYVCERGYAANCLPPNTTFPEIGE